VRRHVIVDAGPLVALIVENDTHHAWTFEQMRTIEAPLLTCEAVLTEAMYLARHQRHGRPSLLAMLNEGFLMIDFRLSEHRSDIANMVKRYDNVPMSLADACLVRMAELNPQSEVFTLDSDFQVYRKHGRAVIDTISPW
jgi:uncharacterized protein